MNFDSHYSRDWQFLAGLASEWSDMRKRFGLGSKATGEQVDEVWNAIFHSAPDHWPHTRRLAKELMRDDALKRHLKKCYWRRLESGERKGYTFEQVHPEIIKRIFLTVLKNAYKWLRLQEELVHWARFWNAKNLTTELRRAIDWMEKCEGVRGVQLAKEPSNEETQRTPEPERDYKGNRPEQPEELAELKEEMLSYCNSEIDKELIADWFDHVRDNPEKEEELVNRYETTTDELNVLIRRIAKGIRDDYEQKGGR